MPADQIPPEPLDPVIAPPTAPGAAVLPPAPPSWPTVLGVLALVIGALQFLMGLLGLISSFFVATPQASQAALERIRVPGLIGGAFSLISDILLVMCGIGLLNRRRWALRWLWIWAVAKFFIAMISTFLGYLSTEATLSDPSLMPSGGFPMMRVFVILGVFIGLIWGWTPPVFVFCWFGREKIRREVMSWR